MSDIEQLDVKPPRATLFSRAYSYDISIVMLLFSLSSLIGLIQNILWVLIDLSPSIIFSGAGISRFMYAFISGINCLLSSAYCMGGPLRYKHRVAIGVLATQSVLNVLAFIANMITLGIGLTDYLSKGNIPSTATAFAEIIMWTVYDGFFTVLPVVLIITRHARRLQPCVWGLPFNYRLYLAIPALAVLGALELAQLQMDPIYLNSSSSIEIIMAVIGVFVAVGLSIAANIIPGPRDGSRLSLVTREASLLILGAVATCVSFLLRLIDTAETHAVIDYTILIVQAVSGITVVGAMYAAAASALPSIMQPVVMSAVPAGVMVLQPTMNNAYFILLSRTSEDGVARPVQVMAGLVYIALVPVATAVAVLTLTPGQKRLAKDRDDEAFTHTQHQQSVNAFLASLAVEADVQTAQHQQVSVMVVVCVGLILSSMSFTASKKAGMDVCRDLWGSLGPTQTGPNYAIIEYYHSTDAMTQVAGRFLGTFSVLFLWGGSVASMAAIGIVLSFIPTIAIIIAKALDNVAAQTFALVVGQSSIDLFMTSMIIGCTSVIRDVNRETLLTGVHILAVEHIGYTCGGFIHDFVISIGDGRVDGSVLIGFGFFRVIAASALLAHPFFWVGRAGRKSYAHLARERASQWVKDLGRRMVAHRGFEVMDDL
ncbi:hypothetical protein J8273_1561 [Carpediemonas membranifera]|uniref:Uncharacterized protein n=1 Tax=Carpediemonas membranifera TaxID=201153 RepID=A0A8J6AXG5_9EUKA|nr:hypothetical protein J8273_1561 [Carpediemonas membranifera]|eukprot:KAG9396553.1 hypothetical protein J8273_1561 [Carpediemonas membranifera]